MFPDIRRETKEKREYILMAHNIVNPWGALQNQWILVNEQQIDYFTDAYFRLPNLIFVHECEVFCDFLSCIDQGIGPLKRFFLGVMQKSLVINFPDNPAAPGNVNLFSSFKAIWYFQSVVFHTVIILFWS